MASYPLVRAPAPDCVLYGCLDQTIANVGSSIVSGVNGTFVGIGAGISGIANGASPFMIKTQVFSVVVCRRRVA